MRTLATVPRIRGWIVARILRCAVSELITPIDGNIFALRAFDSQPIRRKFRFVSDPFKGIFERVSVLRIYLNVGKFLIAVGTAKNPSSHLWTPSKFRLKGL